MRNNAIVVAFCSILVAVFACERGNGNGTTQKVQMHDADEMGLKILSFSNKSGSMDVTFTADGDWYLAIPEDSDWLAVSPSSGFSSGEEVTVHVKVADNPSLSNRIKYISIVCNGREQKDRIKVFQSMTYFLEVTAEKKLVSKVGGYFNFSIKTNGTWSYELDADGQSWLSESGKEGSHLTLFAKPMTTDENHATLVFSSEEDPSLKDTVTVSQKDLELQIQGKHLTANSHAQEIVLEVKATNISSWRIDSAPEWVSAENVDAGHLKLKLHVNASGSMRSGIIKISSPDSEALVSSITVTQLDVAVPAADLLNVSFNADGKAIDISPSAVPIETIPDESRLRVNMDPTYGVFAPTFGFTPGESSNTGFYRIVIPENIKEAISTKGFSMEVILKSASSMNGEAVKPFSAHFNGRGFGLGFSSGTGTNPGQLYFLTINEAPIKTMYAFSGLLPQIGAYYNVIATFDKQTGGTKIYVNGKLMGAGSNSVSGIAIRSTHVMTIGGSPHKTASQKSIEKAWSGELLHPRIYSGVLDEKQVHAVYINNFANHYLLEQK